LSILLGGLTTAIVSGATSVGLAVAGGIVFGCIAVFARMGPLQGLAGAVIGLLMAGVGAPLALSPENWSLALVGLALGGAQRASSKKWLPWVATGLVLLGICLMLGKQGLLWALPLAGAIAGAQWAPALPPRLIHGLVGLTTLAGAAMTLNSGFVQVINTTDRGLLAEWEGGSRVVPARGADAWWTGGRTVVFRARPGGPTFQALPPGDSRRSAPTQAADRAETGQTVPCDELLIPALEGDERHQVALILQGCAAPVRWTSTGAFAARAMTGDGEGALVPLLDAQVTLPLDAVDACILAAQARLGIVEEPGRVLVGGTPYDQAVLLSALDPVGAGLLRRHFERLDEETPGMYRLPLQVLSVSTDSGVH
jgi:hypothetical protein